MITLAQAECTRDKALIAAVKKVEAASQRKTGPRFSAAGEHVIGVLFYPKISWWIADLDADRNPGKPRPLSDHEFEQTWGLKL